MAAAGIALLAIGTLPALAMLFMAAAGYALGAHNLYPHAYGPRPKKRLFGDEFRRRGMGLLSLGLFMVAIALLPGGKIFMAAVVASVSGFGAAEWRFYPAAFIEYQGQTTNEEATA